MALSVKKKGFASSPAHSSGKMCRERTKNMSTTQVYWPVPMRAIGAQNLLTMPGGVTTAGYLHKKGGSQLSLMKWPLRYIIIHKGCVYYFKTSTSATPQGAFSLNGYNRVMRAAEETTSSNVFPFKVVHFRKRNRTWYFSAASEDERRKWMSHLRREIDHYNDRRDYCAPSDSDSDAESFYGSIESPMNITHVAENPEADYLLEEDSDDEEDYLKPDGPSPTAGRPIAPPPSYPPPPVPFHPHLNSPPAPSKGPPPPPPAIPKKPPPSIPVPTPCSLSPSFPPLHAPILPLPKPGCLRGPRSPTPPVPSIDSLRKQIGSRVTSTMPPSEARDRRASPSVVISEPATLPICIGLVKKVALDGHPKPPPFAPPNRPPPPPLPNHYRINKPPFPTVPSPGSKPQSQVTATSPNLALTKPKPPPPKPPLPTAKATARGPSLQRSSPDGQSFRSSVEEVPSAVRKKKKKKCKEDDEDSDDDYENVQLPDSVFVDTTETSMVEKMFKELPSFPDDGIYCFRNSGTKTSKVLVVWDVSLNKARNYRLFEEESEFFLETDYTFSSLADLVEFYYGNPLPNHGSLLLQKPYGYTPPR